jgi:hypothetical protein
MVSIRGSLNARYVYVGTTPFHDSPRAQIIIVTHCKKAPTPFPPAGLGSPEAARIKTPKRQINLGLIPCCHKRTTASLA